MTTLLAVLAFALLFALYVTLRPRFGCSGVCAGCDRECSRPEQRAAGDDSEAQPWRTGTGEPGASFTELPR